VGRATIFRQDSAIGPTERHFHSELGILPISVRMLSLPINLIVLAISAIMFALLLVWWRWPAFRAWIEALKYSMLCQERRFDDQRDEAGNEPAVDGGHA
jgi:hypothetical protein